LRMLRWSSEVWPGLKMFDDISPVLKIIDGISLHISFADVSGPALPVGLSSHATEPKVSAPTGFNPCRRAAPTLARSCGPQNSVVIATAAPSRWLHPAGAWLPRERGLLLKTGCASPVVFSGLPALRSHPGASPGAGRKNACATPDRCAGGKEPWQCSPAAARWPHHFLAFCHAPCPGLNAPGSRAVG
jgi:hypothetical protein